MDRHLIISTGDPVRDEQITASWQHYERRGWVALQSGRYGAGFFIRYRAPDGGHWTVYERWKPAPPPERGSRQRVSWTAVRSALALQWGRGPLTAFCWGSGKRCG